MVTARHAHENPAAVLKSQWVRQPAPMWARQLVMSESGVDASTWTVTLQGDARVGIGHRRFNVSWNWGTRVE